MISFLLHLNFYSSIFDIFFSNICDSLLLSLDFCICWNSSDEQIDKLRFKNRFLVSVLISFHHSFLLPVPLFNISTLIFPGGLFLKFIYESSHIFLIHFRFVHSFSHIRVYSRFIPYKENFLNLYKTWYNFEKVFSV